MSSNSTTDDFSRSRVTGLRAISRRLPGSVKIWLARLLTTLCATPDGDHSSSLSGAPTPGADHTGRSDPRLADGLASVGTAVWRIRNKLPRDGKANLPAELRNLPRYVQGAWDALAAAGIEVQDHKDERYVPGMAVNVITFQPIQGIESEVIHETIKPTVLYHDQLIQRADVIVARPWEAKDGAADGSQPGEAPATLAVDQFPALTANG